MSITTQQYRTLNATSFFWFIFVAKWKYCHSVKREVSYRHRLVVAPVWGGGRGIDWEFGISRCKLLYIEWVSESLLHSTGNYIQRPGINYSGKEYEKECTTCTTESLRCTVETAYMCLLSNVRLFSTPWTVPSEAPLSMEFFRQEYWSGLPFTPPENLPHPGIEPESPVSPVLVGTFFTMAPHSRN